MVAPVPSTQPFGSVAVLRQGAELTAMGVRYCTWAPETRCVRVEIQPRVGGPLRRVELTPLSGGFHEGTDEEGRAGDRYLLSLDGRDGLPDPASRWQPDGVEGASMVVDPSGFEWNDRLWSKVRFRDLVIYELHIGTFTPEGTFRAAIARLDQLRDLGIRAIELMPVADFPGQRNWGYDGVMLFAPARVYGSPDDLRALVDAAHARGIAVILDVVFNHLGPHGNRLRDFSRHYFDSKRQTPWGDAFHFDGPNSGPVRALFCQNLRYWVDEFHVDGFRLDATHAIYDHSSLHILRELRDTAHDCGAFIIAEDERNEEILLAREGFHLDGGWADDFHHSLEVALTNASIYAKRFLGTILELVEILQHGWTRRPAAPARGDLAPQQFVCCISNHDQAGNRPHGDRLSHLTSPEAYRAASAFLCLQPGVPLIFMGQEWAASTPFLYFTDHHAALGRQVEQGRRRDLKQNDVFAREMRARPILGPQNPDAFRRSKLAWSEYDETPHREIRALYRAALEMRGVVPFCRAESFSEFTVQQVQPGVLALRSATSAGGWLLLFSPRGGHVIALSEHAVTASSRTWRIVLSSNDTRFGGDGGADLSESGQELHLNRAELVLLHDHLPS